MRQYIAFIFARGGSKGIPRKNIKKLQGAPLIGYAIEEALKSKYIDRIIVSTDDLEIANVSKSLGAEVPFIRPKELASDTCAEILSWKHAITHLQENGELDIHKDCFISIPTTSPLRIFQDIDNCIEEWIKTKADMSVTITEAHRHPSFNMLKQKQSSDFYKLVLPESNNITRRQDAPKVYDLTTVCYVANPSYVLSTEHLLEGNISASFVPIERSLDIDTEFDFKLAEFLMQNRISK